MTTRYWGDSTGRTILEACLVFFLYLFWLPEIIQVIWERVSHPSSLMWPILSGGFVVAICFVWTLSRLTRLRGFLDLALVATIIWTFYWMVQSRPV